MGSPRPTSKLPALMCDGDTLEPCVSAGLDTAFREVADGGPAIYHLQQKEAGRSEPFREAWAT